MSARDRFLVEQDGEPDFSQWKDFGRLLEFAEKKNVIVNIGNSHSVWTIEVECTGKDVEEIYQAVAENASDIPDITANLIAKALGWIGDENRKF